MNRTYRLVWNHSLRQPQVASELAGSPHGGRSVVAGHGGTRRRSLALACAVALGMAGLLPLSAWAAQGASTGGSGGTDGGTYAGSGGAGNGTGGQGGAGLAGSVGSGGNGGDGGHGGSAISAGGAGGSVGATHIGGSSVTGGDGVDGQVDPDANFMSGGGGGGGAGVYSPDVNLNLGAGLSILGGNGGNGGNGDRFGGGGGGGGAGLVALANAASIDNAGSISGGHGGTGANGEFSGGGGGGGDGILVSGGAARLANTGSIVGGAGGSAGVGSSFAGSHGVAGAGIDLDSDGNAVVNSGSIVGGSNIGSGAGAGILAGNGTWITNQAGGSITGGMTSGRGSVGGAGIVATTSGAQTITIDNDGDILGGFGGASLGGSNPDGIGGIAIAAGGNVTISNGATIKGGDGGGIGGGRGGTGIGISAGSGEQASITNLAGAVVEGGYGGATNSGNYGGIGISASGNVDIINQAGASILSDNGGLSDVSTSGGLAIAAEAGVSIDNSGLIAGTGGLIAGNAINANAASIVNRTGGVIVGGNGQDTALGAVAIVASGATYIDNSGSIVGGHVDDSGAQAKAVMLYGGGNTLLLRAGSSMTGNVTSLSGTGAGGDSFILGGDIDAAGGNALDAGTVDGFADYRKTGASRWTLTGNGSVGQAWTIDGGSLVGDSHSLVAGVVDNATLVFNQAFDGSYAGTLSGSGVLVKDGAGTLALTGANSHLGGTTISAGTLALAGNGALGSGNLAVGGGAMFDISQAATAVRIAALSGNGGMTLGGNSLTLGQAAANSDFGGVIGDGGIAGGSGGNVVIDAAAGTVAFRGANTYTGGTTIHAGTLALRDGGALDAFGAVAIDADGSFDIAAITASGTRIGALTGSGIVDLGGKSLTLGGADDTLFAGSIAGSGGALVKQGSGTLLLDGVNSYSGDTTVQSGTLMIGDAAHAAATVAGDVQVHSGAAVAGHGTVGGNLDVLGGGRLAPGGSIGTLNVGGHASFGQGSQLDFEFGAPGADFHSFGSGDSVNVGGDLSLDGAVLNIIDAGGFGPGLYNLFTYGGTLSESNGGIVFGSTPGSDYSVQYLTAPKQVNLLNTHQLSLDFWNANGLASSSRMGGGSGSWSATSPNWTDASGSVTAPMQPQPGFAIFGGDAGTVTVDNGAGTVGASGMQFAADGYVLDGGPLTLVGSGGAAPVIRVGDGSSAGAAWTAMVGNAIAGNDGLVKADAGTLVLTGNNTYAGGTTISGGSLSVSDDANLGAAGGALTLDGGVLQVTGSTFGGTTRTLSMTASGGGFDIATAGNLFTVAQALSGSGGLRKLGDGTLVLIGANSYTGGTTVTAGTLRGDTASLQGDIVNHGVVVFEQAADGVYAGAVSGGGRVDKNGAGSLTLSGDSHAFAGTAGLAAGALVVDGTLGGTLVTAADTRLSGSGTLGSLDLAGTLAPGHSIGTLSASGDVVIRRGAAYEVETDAAGHSDLLAATGHATLQGGSALNFAADGSYTAQTTYTILTAAGGVEGRFGTVATTLAFLTPQLDYLANAVQLTLARNDVDFCAVAITANQCAVGTAVQKQGHGPLHDALLTQDAATARDALGQWSGESLASTRTALLQDSRFVREAMNDRLHHAGSAQDDGRAIGATAGAVWLHGWDHSGHVDGTGNASRMQSNGSGVLIGVDAPLGDWLRAGITGGAGQDSLTVDALNGSAYAKSRHLGLYAGGNWGGWSLEGGTAAGWHDIRSTRRIGAVLPGTLRADYHGRTRQAYLEGGYRIAGARGSVQPFVNLAHAAVHTGAVNEYGSTTALRSAGETTEVSFGTVGVHGLWQLVDDAAAPLSLYTTLGWRRAFGDRVPLAQQQFADGARFTVEGVPLRANAALVQLGVDAALSRHVSLRAGYDGVLADGASDHAVRMTLQVTF